MSSFIMVFLILLVANYYDLKYGIIPNKLSVFLMVFGIIMNMLIFIALNNQFYPYCYLFYMIFVFIISFILWKMSFWGGGDLKLFCSIGFSLSFIDILNQFYNNSILNNFSFSSQVLFYPKIFSILLNSIVLSFPIVLLLVICRLFKENKLNLLFLVFSDMKFLIKLISTRKVFIADLKEGMVLEDYYFNSLELFNFMKNITENNGESYNLRVNQFREDSYYFKSSSMLGLTKNDIEMINFAYKETLINYPNFKIKIGIPFVPSLTIGFLAFLAFGDLMYLFSTVI